MLWFWQEDTEVTVRSGGSECLFFVQPGMSEGSGSGASSKARCGSKTQVGR